MSIKPPGCKQELAQLAAIITPRKTTKSHTQGSGIQGLSVQDSGVKDFDTDILKQLNYHGITALAANASHLSHDLAAHLAQTAPSNALLVANEALKRAELVRLFESFESAGLSNCVLFKGGALAYSIYPEPWMRPRSDNDCLISRQDYDAFSSLLESNGYKKLFSIEGEYISYQSTFSKPLVGHCVMNIDLHWRINNRQSLAKTFSAQNLLADGTALDRPLQNVKIPCSIDSLLIACLHRLGHHHREERLIWLYDIHLLANSLEKTDWDALCDKAKTKQICAITLDALLNCEYLFSTDIPKNVIQTLSNAHQEPSKLFVQRDLPEWRYILGDLKSLQGVAAKLGFVKENLLPSPTYIRQQMHTRSATIGYIKRLARGIRRIT